MFKSELAKKLASGWINTCWVLIVLLFMFWYILSGLELGTKCAVLLRNTDAVREDPSKRYVESIDKDGTVHLTIGKDVEEEITSYIKVIPGLKNNYYIPKGMLCYPVSLEEMVEYPMQYYVVGVFMFALLLLSGFYSRYFIGMPKAFKVTVYIAMTVFSFIVNCLYSSMFRLLNEKTSLIIFGVTCIYCIIRLNVLCFTGKSKLKSEN